MSKIKQNFITWYNLLCEMQTALEKKQPLSSVVPVVDTFNMTVFGRTNECGTAACALGALAMSGCIKAFSFTMSGDYDETNYLTFIFRGKMVPVSEACFKLFGLPFDACGTIMHLINPSTFALPGDYIQPKHVAARIATILASYHNHTVTTHLQWSSE